jgi:hypothetical protein
MSKQEGVDGLVPFPRELVPRSRIPPILVKLAIGKAAMSAWDGPRGDRRMAYYDNSANPVQTHSKMM